MQQTHLGPVLETADAKQMFENKSRGRKIIKDKTIFTHVCKMAAEMEGKDEQMERVNVERRIFLWNRF